ncbi:Origin recognition complex subunit 1 [Anthophora plagiata]
MASKLNKCSEKQIAAMLDRQSNSDPEIEVYLVDKLTKKKIVKLEIAPKAELNVSSDTENVFHNGKYLLSERKLSQEEISLKVKLRRSTEQSLYKIYTDSDPEKSTFRSHNSDLRQKKNHSEVKSEETPETVTDNVKLSEKQIENKVLRSTRARRAPIRFSSYNCDPLIASNSKRSSVNLPSLRDKKIINYNEDRLLINSIRSNMQAEKKLARQQETESSKSSIANHNLESTPTNSNIKTNKRNRISSVKDENDSGTDCTIVKTKLKKSIKSGSSLNNNSNDSSEIKEIKKEQDLSIPTFMNSTPTRSSKQKRTICEAGQKSIQWVNNSDNDKEEESQSDMYKRIKISSAKKNILVAQKDNRKSRESYMEKTQLSTPKSCSVKCSNLTPSLSKRNNTLLKPVTPLQEARSRLHVSAVPKSLACREVEFNNIFTFLRGKLEDKSGGCIYISGVPGTGKTATVNEAVRCLQKLILRGQLDDFNYVAINGMKLTEPRQAYVQILKQLDGKTATWEQAYHILEKRFHSATSKMTLLLVDELDFLCTKRQDVVYNLLDWPTKSTAQLVVVTIANTMDLPERVLMGRVTSRLGLTRLTFQPYNYKQLQEIVMSRLKDFDGFRSEAVQLVARKVSAVSGDARRALDICRRAMEIAESRDVEMISLQHVTQAVSEMIASAKVQAIKHCSKMEKIFLQAVSVEVVRTSIEEVYFKDAYKQLESLCSFDGIEIPTVTEILAVCGRLGANRLLICEHSRNDIYQKILLNVSTDDIHYAIQELDLNSK